MKTKKMFSKVFALLLAAIMMLAMSTTVFAATITITDSAAGQSYSAWKIFDVTKTSDGKGYAYTLDASKTAIYNAITKANEGKGVTGVTLTLSADKSVYKVEMTNTEDTAKDLASALLAAESRGELGGADGKGTVEDEKTSVEISVKDAGYYFIDSSLGALCFLDTAADSQRIAEKNQKPDIKKEIVKDDSTSSSTSLSVGDTVSFKITVTAGGEADTSYVVHDTMTNGLTLTANSFEIQVGGNNVAIGNYTINTNPTDGHAFDITFNETYTASLKKNTEIVITYKATLNSSAVTKDEETNTATLGYGASSSTDKKVTIYNYDFDLVKTDDSKTVLPGAEFKLYSDKDCKTQVVVSKQQDGSYIVDPTGSADTVIGAGNVTIKGLAAGTYYLVETKAPDGYNALTEAKEFTITDKDLKATVSGTTYTDGGVWVENKAGSALPSTGGIGTTIFYVIGSVMVAGALVLLVVKKRMSSYKD